METKYSEEELLRFDQFLNSTRRRRIHCGLTIDDYYEYQAIDVCEVTGMPLVSGKAGKVSFNTRTLERVDHTKGYVKGNILVVCHSLNRAKAKYEDPSNSRFNTDMDSLELLKHLAKTLVAEWSTNAEIKKMLNQNSLNNA